MQIAADNNQSWIDAHPADASQLTWLNQSRSDALELFNQVGLPNIRDEQWRYTNLRALKSNVFTLSNAVSSKLDSANTKGSQLVFINGHYSAKNSSIDACQNLKLGTLSTHFDAESSDHSATSLRPYLGSTLPDKQHGFTALNSAYCRDGYVLHLPDKQVLTDDIEVLFVNSNEQQQSTVSHVRNLIIAGANSQCRIVERHIGTDGQVYLSNSITEIIAGENAHIDHYKIQQESNDAFHIGGVFISQSSNAQVKNHNIALTGLVTRNDVVATLKGQGAHIEMNGLVIGDGRQHVDNHTEVNHAAPNCSSDEYYKTVLDDHARSVFRGRIIVAQDAQLTNAEQQNNNLLLSKHAEVDTKPQLEIYADDVKCSHGATVGQLDPGSLFYLRSRGIDKASATALLTFAFANEVIERIQVKALRQELTELIAGQLLT